MTAQQIFAWMHVESWRELAWIGVGLGGQAMFTCRFLVQWLASEKAQRSVIPVAFWWLSIAGGAILLAYAIYRRDPVFILGQSMGVFVYGRNLHLIRTERRRAPGGVEPPGSGER